MAKITVTSGHTASGVSLLSGDVMQVRSGGSAIDTKVAGGLQMVGNGGQSTSALVTSGGTMRVSSGAAAVAAQIRAGGRVMVLGGGLAETTRIAGGVEFDFGRTSGTVIGAGGREIVEAGGTADAAVVMAGGRQVVASGGMANDTVLSGGTLVVSAGGSICGGGFAIEAGKAVIAGDVAAWNTVCFTGSRGTLELDHLASFAATIAGFRMAQQKIDLGGFGFSDSETVTWVQSGASGTLTVTDGAKHASLILSGTYSAGDFALADDGHGGTYVAPSRSGLSPSPNRLVEAMAGAGGRLTGGEAGPLQPTEGAAAPPPFRMAVVSGS